MPFSRDLVSVPSSHDVSEGTSPALEKNSLDLTTRQVQAVAKPRRFPSWKQWRHLSRVLNKTERLLCLIAVGFLWLGVLWIAGWYLLTHRVDVPTVGGEYVEGLVGQPQYINPLYASASDVDADLASLIFSGLLKWDPEDGLVPDLASSVTISEDGKTYTITLREDAFFHNGDPVEARDVIFTISAIQDATYRSPLAVSFSGVTVTQSDTSTVVFTLQEPFAPFLSALTVGILPANIWGSIPSAHVSLASSNLEAIGSGPYRFLEFSKDKTGAIRSYTLERFENYYGQKALIERLTFKFYEDTTSALSAFDNRQVEGLGYISFDEQEELEKRRELTIFYPTIRREIALFFNQDAHAALKSSDLRQALAQAVNKQTILDQAARGKGTVIHTPLLSGMTGFHEGIMDIFNIEAANLLLDKTFSWSDDHSYRTDPNIKQEVKEEENDEQEETQEVSSDAQVTEPISDALHFTLTTLASGEYIRAAQQLAEQWKTLGIDLEIKTVASEDFYSQVLEPKNYQMLLTGVLLGVDADPYPFWHSSQTRQGGLNLAGYGNKETDTLLEEARVATDTNVRIEKYRAFQEQLHEDMPAIFLYQSAYGYALPNKIQGVSIPSIIFPSDRFANIADWYIKTKKSLRQETL